MDDSSKLLIGGILLFVGGYLVTSVIESESEIDYHDYAEYEDCDVYADYDEIDEQ